MDTRLTATDSLVALRSLLTSCKNSSPLLWHQTVLSISFIQMPLKCWQDIILILIPLLLVPPFTNNDRNDRLCDLVQVLDASFELLRNCSDLDAVEPCLLKSRVNVVFRIPSWVHTGHEFLGSWEW